MNVTVETVENTSSSASLMKVQLRVALFRTPRFWALLPLGCFLLSLSLGFGFLQEERQEALWQVGAFFSLFLNVLITHLCLQEIKALELESSHQFQEMTKLYNQSELDFLQFKNQALEYERQLRYEIEELKKQISLREQEAYDKQTHYQLIESEINQITRQKNSLVEEAKQMRERAYLESCNATALQEAMEELKAKIQTLENAPPIIERVPVVETIIQPDPETLKRATLLEEECALLQEMLKELEARPPIIQTVTVTDPASSEKIKQMEEEIADLKTRPALTETIVQRIEVPGGDIQALEKELKSTEGALKQLRLQFEEKSKELSKTRHELFKVSEELLALEREATLFGNEEELLLEKEYLKLAKELEAAEMEIALLEELIVD